MDMRQMKLLIAAAIMAFSSLVAFAGPAGAVVCIEDMPTPCCGTVQILGKDYQVIPINC